MTNTTQVINPTGRYERHELAGIEWRSDGPAGMVPEKEASELVKQFAETHPPENGAAKAVYQHRRVSIEISRQSTYDAPTLRLAPQTRR